MRSFGTALRHTVKVFGSQRKLWVPFLIVAGLEAIFLGLIWLAPQAPFSKLLAPPIRYFFGDRVLHYPVHLWFLYHAMKHTHLAASTLLGAFMSAVACAMVRQTYEGTPLSLRNALVSGQARYGAVLLIWLVTWGSARLFMGALGHWAPKAGWVMWAALGSTVVLQTLLVYAIPATVFAAAKWWKALWLGIRETLRHPVSTLVVVTVPTTAVIAFSVAFPEGRIGQWMQQGTAEIVFIFIVGQLILWTVADVLVTIGVAHLWFSHRSQPSVQTSRSPFPVPLASSIVSLLLVFAALSSTGCSATYNGERLFSKATHLYKPISKDPKAASPEQFAAAIRAFERVTTEARGTEWAARAHVSIGSLYAIQQEYDKAREAYGLTLQNYNQYKDLCLTARTAMAKTYESEANWDEAVKMYRDIIDFYPWTKMGLESPLYIGAMYVKRQQPEQAKKAFESAVGHYTQLIPNAPNPEMSLAVKGYLALAYQQVGDWDHAIAVLEELAGAPNSNSVNRPLVLLSLGSIYQAKLGDAQKAQAAYSALVAEFPDHPLGKVAKTRLEHLAISIVPR